MIDRLMKWMRERPTPGTKLAPTKDTHQTSILPPRTASDIQKLHEMKASYEAHQQAKAKAGYGVPPRSLMRFNEDVPQNLDSLRGRDFRVAIASAFQNQEALDRIELQGIHLSDTQKEQLVNLMDKGTPKDVALSTAIKSEMSAAEKWETE